MAKILLIEDDPKYGGLVKDFLSAQKHNVELTENVEDALAFLDTYQYEVLIVDWQLPDVEGPTLIKSLRTKGFSTPIIMLTGRDSIADKEFGFGCGADDYLSKASDPRELLLRVQALLRRPQVYQNSVVNVRNIEVDYVARSVTKNGAKIHLLPKEFSVLEFITKHPTRVFSAEELLERLWPSDTEATSHTVRSCINKIRTKLDDENGPSLILTKYKAGYQLNLED